VYSHLTSTTHADDDHKRVLVQRCLADIKATRGRVRVRATDDGSEVRNHRQLCVKTLGSVEGGREQETIGRDCTIQNKTCQRRNQREKTRRRGRRPHAKSKATSGKELARYMQHVASMKGPEINGRTYGGPTQSMMPYPPPLGTTCIGEFIACFITSPVISSPLPLHELGTAVLMWSADVPILLAIVKSDIAFDSS